MALRLKTAPATEPVSLTEAKLFLRVDHTEEDALISDLISAAREMVENRILRALITQTWTLTLDFFPAARSPDWWDGVRQASINSIDEGGRTIVLPRPPLVSVTHLKTYGEDNVATTYSSDNYIVDLTSQPGRLVLENGQVWPADLRAARAIEVEFVAGYGAASDVPKALKTAIMMILAKMYECRGEAVEMPTMAEKLISPFSVQYLQGPNDRTEK